MTVEEAARLFCLSSLGGSLLFGIMYVFASRVKVGGLGVDARKAIETLLGRGCDVEKSRYRLYRSETSSGKVTYTILNFNKDGNLVEDESFDERHEAVEQFAHLTGLE